MSIPKLSVAQIIHVGFAKKGTGHWWLQRVTAVALVPLSYFVIRWFDLCFNASYQQVLDWITFPINTLGMVMWLLAVFYHAALGLQVVIDDYIAHPGLKTLSLWGVNVGFSLLGITAVVAVLRLLSIG